MKVGPEPFGSELEVGSWKLEGTSRQLAGARFEKLDSRFETKGGR